jgi:hypothetical protein
MTKTTRWMTGVLISCLAAASAGAQTSDRPDGMRFVPNVHDQFSALNERAEPLGFHIGGSPDPSSCKHYQGMVRIDGADGTPFFLVTRSGNVPSSDPSGGLFCDDSDGETDNGHLIVFRMDSRPRHGERLRSNRLRRGSSFDVTPPPVEDKASIYYTVVGGDPADPDPSRRPGLVFRDGEGTTLQRVYQHPGGMQLVGKILALAVESPKDGTVPRTQIMFFDVSDPEAPVFKSQYAPINGAGEVLAAAGVVGVTPLPGGRYLMMTSGGDNTTWFFYRSTLPDLSSANLLWDFIGSVPGPTVQHPHNTLSFLRQGDVNGPLYLAGARGRIVSQDRDRIDLYEVACSTPDCEPGESISVAVVLNGKRITPYSTQGGLFELASLAAAATFYVSPSGELIFYATEHDNGGPDHTVRAGEWRHHHVVREDSPTLLPTAVVNGPYEVDEGGTVTLTGSAGPPVTKAFLEIFTGLDLTEYSLIGDIDDIPLDDFDDLADVTRSWNWYAPVGCTAFAVDRDRPAAKTLPGTGAIARDPDLRQVQSDAGTTHMDQKVDEIGFDTVGCGQYYSGAFVLRWDLDVDGSFESTGSPVNFTAAAFDGPSVVTVPARAEDRASGPAGHNAAKVTVRNVAPQLTAFRISDSAGHVVNENVPFVLTNLPVTLIAAFGDTGVLDHQSATIAWGNGTVDAETAFTLFDEAFGDAAGAVAHTRAYASPGSYPLALTVRDDDGGEDTASAVVRVLTPEQAVAEIIGLIDQAIASATSAAVRKSLEHARKAVAGSNDHSQNGALAKIRAGNRPAARAFLGQAITWIERAQSDGGNVAVLLALLEQVVLALAA